MDGNHSCHLLACLLLLLSDISFLAHHGQTAVVPPEMLMEAGAACLSSSGRLPLTGGASRDSLLEAFNHTDELQLSLQGFSN